MKIFNVEIFSSDAKWFCELSKEEKAEWIFNNTNQKDLAQIEEFLSKPLINNDCGCGCGGNKTINNANITSGIPTTIANSTETTKVTGDSSGTNTQRRGKRKTTKGS